MWFKKSSALGLNPNTPALPKKELPDVEGGNIGATTRGNDTTRLRRYDAITTQHPATARLAMPKPVRPFDLVNLAKEVDGIPVRRAASINPESLRGTPRVASTRGTSMREPPSQRPASTRPDHHHHRTRTTSSSSSIPQATPEWGIKRTIPQETPAWGLRSKPLPSKEARAPATEAVPPVRRSSSETRRDSYAVRRVPSDRESRSVVREVPRRDSSAARRDSSGSRGRPSQTPPKGILKNVQSSPFVEDDYLDAPAPHLHWQLLGHATRSRNPGLALRFDIARPFEAISLLRRDVFRPAVLEELKVPAADRTLRHMIIRYFTNLRTIGSVIVEVEGRAGGIRCYDVFEAIYRKFHEPLSSKHLAMLSAQQLDTCTRFLRRRCQKASVNLPLWEEGRGLKYVDLLCGKTSFAGLQNHPTMPGEYTIVFEEGSWVHN